MRMETLDAAVAFVHGQPYQGQNTEVMIHHDRVGLFLHGTCVMAMRGDKVGLSLGGYPTNVTLERLNGVCEILWNKRPFFRRGGKVYFQTLAREVDPEEIITMPRVLPAEVI